jgi:hypothetical protein
VRYLHIDQAIRLFRVQQEMGWWREDHQFGLR